jgi:hypothetical protein
VFLAPPFLTSVPDTSSSQGLSIDTIDNREGVTFRD